VKWLEDLFCGIPKHGKINNIIRINIKLITSVKNYLFQFDSLKLYFIFDCYPNGYNGKRAKRYRDVECKHATNKVNYRTA
tara:strand:+ start:576 stop:815 length:240 start_codon:yes stop_codon:yes gene_type:complete